MSTWAVFKHLWIVIGGLLIALFAISILFFVLAAERTGDKLITELAPDPDDVRELATTTPASFWVHDGVTPDGRPLSRAKTRNINWIYYLLMFGNFLAVGFLTMVTLIGFGLLAFDRSVQAMLMGPGGRLNVIVSRSIAASGRSAARLLVVSWPGGTAHIGAIASSR